MSVEVEMARIGAVKVPSRDDDFEQWLDSLTEYDPKVIGFDAKSGTVVFYPKVGITELVRVRPARCALCGMEPHGAGYCGHGPYSRADPFCRRCYSTGDNCQHTAAERAAFDREEA
jgi:hypothetical protein